MVRMTNSQSNAKPATRGPGRPRKDAPLRVSWKKFELAAKAGCTQASCAGYTGISVPTLKKRAEKRYGLPLAEVMADLASCGEGERLISQHRLATGQGPGSNAARAAYRPPVRGGGVTVNIDARQGRLIDRTPSIVIADEELIGLLPKDHEFIQDEDTGRLRLTSLAEQAELNEIPGPRAIAMIPKNGFEFTESETD